MCMAGTTTELIELFPEVLSELVDAGVPCLDVSPGRGLRP